MIQRIFLAVLAVLILLLATPMGGQMRASDIRHQKERELAWADREYQQQLRFHREQCQRQDRQLYEQYQDARRRIQQKYTR